MAQSAGILQGKTAISAIGCMMDCTAMAPGHLSGAANNGRRAERAWYAPTMHAAAPMGSDAIVRSFAHRPGKLVIGGAARRVDGASSHGGYRGRGGRESLGA
jgi:hypothetical protein